MGESRRSLLRALRAGMVGIALALTSSCGSRPEVRTSPPPPAVAALPLAPSDVATVARLLQLEDSREFSEPDLRVAAVAGSAEVRRRAALAIGRLRRTQGVAILADLLDDPDSSVAATAAFALGQLGDTTVVALLAPLLADDVVSARPTVASEAAYALGKLPSPSGHAALVSLLGRTGELPSPVVGSALLAIWRFPRPADLAPLLRWTSSPDPELRWRAAYALTRRPTPAATPLLQRLALDPDARVRALALRGLTAPLADSSGVGAVETLPIVLGAVSDTSYSVRVNALRSLGSYADPRAVRALIAELRPQGRHATLAAVESLGRIGPTASEAASPLRSLALSPDAPVAIRQEALVSLLRVDPTAAGTVARQLAASTEWRLRAASARVLVGVTNPRAGEVDRLLRDPDGRVAAAALQGALDAAGGSVLPLRPVLLEALGASDIWVRVAALGGLARLRDPATLPLLLDAYQRASADSLNDAALAAVDAVAALQGSGAPSNRTFFARFRRSPDYLVRLRVREHFGAAADSAWGAALPLQTGRTLAEYRSLVERWIAPPPAERVHPEVELETDAGRIRLRLFAADAPLTVQSLLDLAGAGYFDGQEWPRVVPNFVVQGGDPRGDTSGGPGYSIRDEINRHRYGTGSVGMALSGPDTGGSQFFVTHSPQPHLDGVYTLFGELVEGRGAMEATLPGERIRTIRIVM